MSSWPSVHVMKGLTKHTSLNNLHVVCLSLCLFHHTVSSRFRLMRSTSPLGIGVSNFVCHSLVEKNIMLNLHHKSLSWCEQCGVAFYYRIWIMKINKAASELFLALSRILYGVFSWSFLFYGLYSFPFRPNYIHWTTMFVYTITSNLNAIINYGITCVLFTIWSQQAPECFLGYFWFHLQVYMVIVVVCGWMKSRCWLIKHFIWVTVRQACINNH